MQQEQVSLAFANALLTKTIPQIAREMSVTLERDVGLRNMRDEWKPLAHELFRNVGRLPEATRMLPGEAESQLEWIEYLVNVNLDTKQFKGLLTDDSKYEFINEFYNIIREHGWRILDREVNGAQIALPKSGSDVNLEAT